MGKDRELELRDSSGNKPGRYKGLAHRAGFASALNARSQSSVSKKADDFRPTFG